MFLMATPLFDQLNRNAVEPLDDGAFLLPGFAIANQREMVQAIANVAGRAPFRHMTTPGGFRMSVAMTNCGSVGWVTDRGGYRYSSIDPESGKEWPPMPSLFKDIAVAAAARAGFLQFAPNACLINRYGPGAKMSLHQDRDELDLAAPIVSMSFGLDAIFLFGGPTRKVRPRRLPLASGDVVVWGGPARLHYHGVAPLKDGSHLLTGNIRYNLTFRKSR